MKTKTTKKGETCTPMEDNPRKKCYNQLMELKKSDIADMAAEMVSLVHNLCGNQETAFGQGWNDSRRSLIMLCNLSKYWSHE